MSLKKEHYNNTVWECYGKVKKWAKRTSMKLVRRRLKKELAEELETNEKNV